MTHQPDSAHDTRGRFHDILVACSRSEDDDELIRLAARLTPDRETPITLLSVVEPPSDLSVVARLAGMSTSAVTQQLADEHRAELEDCAARVAPEQAVRIQIAVDKPFLAIIRETLARSVDLVIKTAGALEDHFPMFLSTDQHLLRKCPCPVWLRLPGAPDDMSTVVAAVDVDDAFAAEPETLAGLNRRVVEAALQIVSPGGAVHVLHVWDTPGEALLRRFSNAPDADATIQSYRQEIWATHRRALDRLVDEATAWTGSSQRVSVLARLVQGSARTVIPQQARQLEAGALVLGTTARVGIPGLLIGTTAEDILNTASSSVLTVTPPGFVSPLTLP